MAFISLGKKINNIMEELKVNELRAGNLIHVLDEDFNKEVLRVNLNDMCNVECSSGIDDFEPIPITEEWLLEMGFELHDDCGELKGNDRFCSHRKLMGCFRLPNYEWSLNGKKIKYLHTLQNLYFALTEEELNIKL